MNNPECSIIGCYILQVFNEVVKHVHSHMEVLEWGWSLGQCPNYISILKHHTNICTLMCRKMIGMQLGQELGQVLGQCPNTYNLKSSQLVGVIQRVG